ncbi:doublesex- and mab-3-related transcription factor C2-like isoform X2 [Daphnia carinata]|uniref:doublesex- and mab-3-related transcription factor C2-like isoform X2 n=1 Tax=Daphnia carinata TaxID=120202 RepID=UPI00257D1484|nr:doublesex- and mab-3-related transcription factor C2-like isoform X2 [Daphnia carinata]
MPFNNEESFEMLSPSSLNQFDHSETIDVEHMDEDDELKSSPTSFGTGKGASCRNPTCALCKNHGINSPLKGHKRYCPFGRCSCDLCRVTRKKQKINASQVASRRAQQQDRELGIDRPTMQPNTSSGSTTPRTFASSISPSDLGRNSTRSALDVDRPLSEPNTTQYMPSHYAPGSGPQEFGKNMALECFLLGRRASLLVNSLRDSKLTVEHLAYLDNDVYCSGNRFLMPVRNPLWLFHHTLPTSLQSFRNSPIERRRKMRLAQLNYTVTPAETPSFAHHVIFLFLCIPMLINDWAVRYL